MAGVLVGSFLAVGAFFIGLACGYKRGYASGYYDGMVKKWRDPAYDKRGPSGAAPTR